MTDNADPLRRVTTIGPSPTAHHERTRLALDHAPARIRAAHLRAMDLRDRLTDLDFRRDAYRSARLLIVLADLKAANEKTNAEQREAMLAENLATDITWEGMEREHKTLTRDAKLADLDATYEENVFRATLASARMIGGDTL